MQIEWAFPKRSVSIFPRLGRCEAKRERKLCIHMGKFDKTGKTSGMVLPVHCICVFLFDSCSCKIIVLL